ncbi:AAA family ATPase [Agromyces neolithicus]|uniref:Nuclease SbcCD subunit C n=1 Tax=Agromyces neolithicus TaxID=269420 RepID=A0ABN2M9I0_9MICO
MVDDLLHWIASRIETDTTLADESKPLVLAALEGDAELADLAGYTPPKLVAVEDEKAPEPVGAFLKQIKVEGFRGIGPAAQLDIEPGPGLTIITGRNGSGKSSFAEALEMALTRTTYRWAHRSKQWEDAWRNIHSPNPARVDVTLVEESVGPTRLSVTWNADAAWSEASVTLQRQGQKRKGGAESLGWNGPLETYRPLLSYEELGVTLTGEPSRLHDAIATVLGLEQLTEAIKRLGIRNRELAAPGAAVAAEKKALTATLAQLDDERALQALTLVKKRKHDLQALSDLATGVSGEESEEAAWLQAILSLALPSIDNTEGAVAELRSAVAEMANAGDTAAEELERRMSLLDAALELHRHEGDQPCPVCGVGALDEAWARSAASVVTSSQAELDGLRRARARLFTTRTNARGLIAPVPHSVTDGTDIGLADELTAVRDAWDAWSEAPEGDLTLCDHIETHRIALSDTLDALQLAVQQIVSARDDAWSNVAVQLAAFVEASERWEIQQYESEATKAALKWLKENEVELKNERVRPISERASEIWESLRQESNVGITGLKLEGAATRRRVAIEASVDGQEAGGLAVMSQGELHALALALFLPRATMPASPFRFVVLDDPVQAMDPAKVDGLVEVLTSIAASRQVVVFSHDDRLAAAVRRAQVKARILEVTRQTGSLVEVTNTFDPPQRYLRDAAAIVKDAGLPDATLRRTLPGMLRLAVEAQASGSTPPSSHAVPLTPRSSRHGMRTRRHPSASRLLCMASRGRSTRGSTSGRADEWDSASARRPCMSA